MTRTLLTLLGLALLAGAEDEKPYWVGKKLPSLPTKEDHWFNGRLRAGDLKGKIVWVQFGFLG